MESVANQESKYDRAVVEANLTHHWALDPVAANEVSNGITDDGCEYIDNVLKGIEDQWEAIEARDQHREDIGKIFRGESDKHLIVVGPCSLDAETDYEELFQYIEDLQEEHPDSVIALRANGSKPRSKGGWGGLVRSTNPSEQEKTVDIYQEAFERKIPIITEITDRDEYAALAPYLSGAWLGARDMQSTSLHNLAMASRLPWAIKNGTDGKADTVENVLTAIGKNTEENEGSGVNLGILAATYQPNGVGLPAMVEVGEGNKSLAIIARGYELPEGMEDDEKAQAAIQHLGEMCTLGAKVDCAVLLDGGHGVPAMFKINRKAEDRFPKVEQMFSKAISTGQVPNADRLRGKIIELGSTVGRTDPNWPLAAAKGGLSTILTRSRVAIEFHTAASA